MATILQFAKQQHQNREIDKASILACAKADPLLMLDIKRDDFLNEIRMRTLACVLAFAKDGVCRMTHKEIAGITEDHASRVSEAIRKLARLGYLKQDGNKRILITGEGLPNEPNNPDRVFAAVRSKVLLGR